MTDITQTPLDNQETLAKEISSQFSEDEAYLIDQLNGLIEELAEKGMEIPKERLAVSPLSEQRGDDLVHVGFSFTYLTGINQEFQLFYRKVDNGRLEESPLGESEQWLSFYRQYPDADLIGLVDALVRDLENQGYQTYDVQWFDMEGIEKQDKLYFPLVVLGHEDGRTVIFKTDPVDLDLVDIATPDSDDARGTFGDTMAIVEESPYIPE